MALPNGTHPSKEVHLLPASLLFSKSVFIDVLVLSTQTSREGLLSVPEFSVQQELLLMRPCKCLQIMAFSMGVVLTFMFAHHPQSPLPGNDARAAVAHGYQMTVNPANERQLASESQPVMRRQNVESNGGISNDW